MKRIISIISLFCFALAAYCEHDKTTYYMPDKSRTSSTRSSHWVATQNSTCSRAKTISEPATVRSAVNGWHGFSAIRRREWNLSPTMWMTVTPQLRPATTCRGGVSPTAIRAYKSSG